MRKLKKKNTISTKTREIKKTLQVKRKMRNLNTKKYNKKKPFLLPEVGKLKARIGQYNA